MTISLAADGSDPRIVFVDIDTQVDFMLPHGKLYIEDSRDILGNLHRLLEYALMNRILILQTFDTHTENDPEFSAYGFPPHCVAGTPGWRRVPETELAADAVMTIDGPLPELQQARVVGIEKPSFSILSNPQALTLLKQLRPCEFVVFGVATEGCVRRSILSLRSLGFAVSVVIDAVAAGRRRAGEEALEEFASLGVRPLITDDIRAGALMRRRLSAGAATLI